MTFGSLTIDPSAKNDITAQTGVGYWSMCMSAARSGTLPSGMCM